MRYWNDNRKSCEHVEPREDWKESIEKWIDWMDAIGRTNDTLRTRWYQIVRFSKAVDKSITDVTEDDLIFYLAGMGTEGRRGVRSCVKVFYQWSMKRGLARRNPADEVPTVPMTLPSGCICPEENRIKTVTGYPSHSLRRRFATCVYYRNGCNIVLVSRMLGHANIATTMRYIGLVQDEMRNAVESTTRTDMRLTMPMNQVVGTAGSVATYSHSTARIG